MKSTITILATLGLLASPASSWAQDDDLVLCFIRSHGSHNRTEQNRYNNHKYFVHRSNLL